MAKVWIAGAGCGSLQGITLQVLSLLKRCDVLVYDDLISADILDEFTGSRKIYAGKRKDVHSYSQEQINELLIDLAKDPENANILRLKGGDPFVFGRGMEEVLALRDANIDYEVCPGLSSCIAVPERMEIPVTHRAMASGFMVVSAVRVNTFSWKQDVKAMAAFSGTIEILMGYSRLEQICKDLIEAGKDPKTPASVLSSPDIKDTTLASGTLETISEISQNAGLQTPAIILIGETAGFARDKDKRDDQDMVSSPVKKPDKIRVGLVCTDGFAESIQKNLDLNRFELVPLCHMQAKADPYNTVEDLVSEVAWLVFTSRTGAEIFLKQYREVHGTMWELNNFKIACIGPATAKVFTDAGLKPALIPKEHTTEGLARALITKIGWDEYVQIFRSAKAEQSMKKMLKGCKTRRIAEFDFYDMEYQKPEKDLLNEELDSLDYVVIGSAASARWYLENYDLKAMPAVLSPVSARPFFQACKNCLVADEISAKSLCQKLKQAADHKK